MTNDLALRIGRAKNALLTFLETRLAVPKIYVDAVWDGETVDLLAIDRDGVGDVSVILLVLTNFSSVPDDAEPLTRAVLPTLHRFESLPAQYKYVAVVDISANGTLVIAGSPQVISDLSFSPDGMGRVGFLRVDFPTLDEPRIHILFKPERFRAKIAKLADEYVQQHEADWEIRA